MGIDLNTIEEEEEDEPEQHPAHHAVSAAAAAVEAFQPASVCLELWHACAGPRIWLPKKGSLVVYLPQGHLEHSREGDDGSGGRGGVGSGYDVPPHGFKKVGFLASYLALLGLQWTQADAATDEVYAQLSLVVESEDYKQQRPSQELIAKDLHSMEWKFRHIYRGIYPNQMSFEEFDFLDEYRGNDGVLRLGVRRAPQFKGSSPVLEHQSGNMNLSTLAAVADAVSNKKAFDIYYNPRYVWF
ncbi:hypothetical protein GW17_00045671 [Ensete ventricosum]|nr:hypothetical protein GW17_00045671 [Ensete ventricosum]RZS28199.1 hypothetical protein BHM03_00061767 [Ensete ventricosum]